MCLGRSPTQSGRRVALLRVLRKSKRGREDESQEQRERLVEVVVVLVLFVLAAAMGLRHLAAANADPV